MSNNQRESPARKEARLRDQQQKLELRDYFKENLADAGNTMFSSWPVLFGSILILVVIGIFTFPYIARDLFMKLMPPRIYISRAIWLALIAISFFYVRRLNRLKTVTGYYRIKVGIFVVVMGCLIYYLNSIHWLYFRL